MFMMWMCDATARYATQKGTLNMVPKIRYSRINDKGKCDIQHVPLVSNGQNVAIEISSTLIFIKIYYPIRAACSISHIVYVYV